MENNWNVYSISAATETNCNDGKLVALGQHSILFYENDNENHDSIMPSIPVSQTDNAVRQAASTPNRDEFNCNVYMREKDFNRFMQCGHLFIDQGRFYYKWPYSIQFLLLSKSIISFYFKQLLTFYSHTYFEDEKHNHNKIQLNHLVPFHVELLFILKTAIYYFCFPKCRRNRSHR